VGAQVKEWFKATFVPQVLQIHKLRNCRMDRLGVWSCCLKAQPPSPQLHTHRSYSQRLDQRKSIQREWRLHLHLHTASALHIETQTPRSPLVRQVGHSHWQATAIVNHPFRRFNAAQGSGCPLELLACTYLLLLLLHLFFST
jgi:hypothetical protein